MTKTVTIAATRTNGDPYAHHDVIVTLVAGSAGGVVGSNVIVSQTKVPLNASGQGSIVLATNDVEITSPSTSFYRFTVEGSSPTITRSVRITDALPSTISWTRSGIEVGDPTIPQRDVSSDYVQVGDQSLTNYLADLETGGGGSSDNVTVPDGTMAFIGAYYPPASDDLTDHLDSIDDAFVGAAQAIVAVGAASIDNDQKGAPNGVAELDGSGLVLSSHLPSYVDDVIVVADFAALPGTGADGKIYVTSDTNLTYRWTGSAYAEISKSLALGTTSSTAYRGDHGAATAAGLADGSGVSDPAAFRGNLGLGAIATQPAIYRPDIATGAIDAALLDPALAAEIAAAVPNTRTITAGTGLTGGGTLASDRTIAIDTATLARIGTTVEATSDTAARTSTTAVADGVLEFTAAADTSYRIDAYLIFQGDATADLKFGFTIPTGTIHATVEGGLTTIASGGDYDRFLTLTLSTQTVIVGIAGASTPVAIRISGVIHTTAAGTVALIWAPNAAGAGTGVTRLARSQIYYRAA